MSDTVPVLVEFGAMESEEGDEHIPFICITVEGDDPIHFHCDCAFETEQGAKACLEIVERALRSESLTSH